MQIHDRQIALEQLSRVADTDNLESPRKRNARAASEAIEAHASASGAAEVAALVEKAHNIKKVESAADEERERRVFLPTPDKLAAVEACRKKSDAIEHHAGASGAARVARLVEQANNVAAVTRAADDERDRRVAAAMLGRGVPTEAGNARKISTALKVDTRFKLARGEGARALAAKIEEAMRRRNEENAAPRKTWARVRNASAEGLFRARKQAPKGPRPPKKSWRDLP